MLAQTDQTPAHILQEFLLYTVLKSLTVPQEAVLYTKLSGSADHLVGLVVKAFA